MSRMSLALAACLALGACTKKDDATPAASASASAPVVVIDAAPAEPTAWTGKFTAVEATLYVTEGTRDAGLKFRGEDASTGLGEGTLKVAVDATTHAVSGSMDGPLGELELDGLRDHDDVTFTVRPKGATSDESYFGTGSAKLTAGKLSGTMRLSRARANVIREVSFALQAGS